MQCFVDVISTLRATFYQRCVTLKIRHRILFHFQRGINVISILARQKFTTALFTGTGKSKSCGKSVLVSNLIEKEYQKHFEYIINICSTLRLNMTYLNKSCIKHDDNVWIIEPKDKLYQWVEKLPQLLEGSETLFIIIHEVIVDKSLDEERQAILELAISGRHCLCLLTQSYSVIPKNLRKQVKSIFVLNPKKRKTLRWYMVKFIVLTDDELVIIMDCLKTSKKCIFMHSK